MHVKTPGILGFRRIKDGRDTGVPPEKWTVS